MVKQYNGKVRVVYKNYVVHPDTVTEAHLAACAAGKQGKFMEFKKLFWEKGFGEYKKTRDPSVMAGDALVAMAGEIGLDAARFDADRNSDQCRGLLATDMKELAKFGVNGTPSFFVNGKFSMFSSAQAFKGIIDRELAEVEKSGVPAGEYYQKEVIDKGSKTFVSKADRSN